MKGLESFNNLFLFVATRELARLPVLMFIHGESYEWNAGSTVDGSVLASASGLVVVTINYRLGILGKSTASNLTPRLIAPVH